MQSSDQFHLGETKVSCGRNYLELTISIPTVSIDHPKRKVESPDLLITFLYFSSIFLGR